MGDVIVTKEIAFLGMRVRRGKDWIHGNQDTTSGGSGVGTIIDLEVSDLPGWINVKWDSGLSYKYRVGDGGNFDLYLYTPSTTSYTPAPVATTNTPTYLPFLTSTIGVHPGDKLVFTRHWGDSKFCSEQSKILLDSVVTVKELSVGGTSLRLEESGDWYFNVACFTRASKVQEVRKELEKAVSSSAKTQISSKPIKTSQNDKEKSTVSSSIGECGYAFKVRRPVAKIQRGKGSGKATVRS